MHEPTERAPRVLLANHHTLALPDVAPALRRRGVEVAVSLDIVDTAARFADFEPDLVLFQPLTGDVDGFEIQHVLSLGTGARKPALVLVLHEASAVEQLLARPTLAVDDFLVGSPSAEELLLRVDFDLRRRRALRDLEHSARSLETQTITDFKTGLFNDRYLVRRVAEEVERARRHRHAVSLLLFDVDDFKQVNERFDHFFGDHVLAALGDVVRGTIRTIDLPARLGGDEFGVLLPMTDLDEAVLVATRLRAVVAEHRFEQEGRATRLTLSIGVDAVHGEDAIDPAEFMRRADLALLEAKKRGKNRICLYAEVSGRPAAAPP
jgi:diguanylate cyclase (GGDEF)-like protein